MTLKISKNDARDALREQLQALALPGWKQLRLFKEAQQGLTKSIRTWRSQSPMVALIRSQKTARREKLERIRGLVAQVGRKDVDPYIFRNTEGKDECKEIRRLAGELLDDYGWPRKAPPKHSAFLEGLWPAQARKPKTPLKPRWHQLKRRPFHKRASCDLSYHQAVFNLLDLCPEVAKQNVNRLRRREQQCGLKFPAAVFELYSLRYVDDIFFDNTNQDSLVELPDFGEQLEMKDDVDYLKVAIENQGVVTWHVPLDPGDDPPVLQAPDGVVSMGEIVSAAFSNFVFDMIANNYFRGWTTGMHLEAKATMPDQGLLRRIRKRFREGPRTRHRTSTVHRFFTPEGILTISSNTPRDRAANRGLWKIEASSAESLFKIAREVWDYQDVAKKIKATALGPEERSRGRDVLKQLRRPQVHDCADPNSRSSAF